MSDNGFLGGIWTRTPIVPGLILCIALAHILRILTPVEVQNALIGALAIIPERFDPAGAYAYAQPWQALVPLFGHVFLHAGFLHLGFNTLAMLQVAGPLAERMDEDRFGALRFLALFFGCAAAGGLCYVLLNPASDTPALGASGAICGLFAGYFLSLTPVWHNAFRDRRVLRAGFWFLLVNVGLAAAARAGGILPIAWEAHLGGFLGGVVLYPLLAPRQRTSFRS